MARSSLHFLDQPGGMYNSASQIASLLPLQVACVQWKEFWVAAAWCKYLFLYLGQFAVVVCVDIL